MISTDIKMSNYVKIEYGNDQTNGTAKGNTNLEERVNVGLQLNKTSLKQCT